MFFIHDMIFYFNIFVLQEFQMLALSLLTAVAVIVKSFCEKKRIVHIHWRSPEEKY